MKIELQEISPARAKRLLESNTENRPISKRRVDTLVRDIAAGAWSVNESAGNPVAIREDGVLANGQHRLLAISKGTVTVACWVIVGMPKDVPMDNVRPRSFADNLGMSGTRNASAIAAASRILFNYAIGQSLHNAPTQSEHRSTFDAFRDELMVTGSQFYNGVRPPLRLVAVLAATIVAGLKHEDVAKEFMDKYMTGAGLMPADPVLALRERLTRDKEARHNTSLGFGLACSALNAMIERRTLSKIYSGVGSGTLPEIKGVPPEVVLARLVKP